MKSNIVTKLIEICPPESGENMTFGKTNLTDEQLVKVQDTLIEFYGFKRIVWTDLPTGLTEYQKEAFAVQSHKLNDEIQSDDRYKDKVAYVYTLMFTPVMYDPTEIYKPVKDGCVLSPVMYDPQSFLPTRSITIEWSPEFPVDLEKPMSWEDEKKIIHDKLEMVLENPDEYKPNGYRGAILRFAAK